MFVSINYILFCFSKWAKESQDYFLNLWKKGLASECGLSLLPVICLSKEYDTLPEWFSIAIGGYKLTHVQVTKYAQLHQRKYTYAIIHKLIQFDYVLYV